MYQVTKRDGQLVSFDIAKISSAIKKAFDSIEKPYDDNVIDFISLKVTADFAGKVREGKVAVEDIQDSVEKVLGEAGYGDVAKSYILYRKQREKMRNMKSTILDYKGVVDNYLRLNDWRVKENSTVTYSVGGLILSNSGAITANYWLSEVYDEETIRKWLRTFLRRFFNQQFKRSCLPDGPKVGSVSLSPRGDWRMPSDASSEAWLAEC